MTNYSPTTPERITRIFDLGKRAYIYGNPIRGAKLLDKAIELQSQRMDLLHVKEVNQ